MAGKGANTCFMLAFRRQKLWQTSRQIDAGSAKSRNLFDFDITGEFIIAIPRGIE